MRVSGIGSWRCVLVGKLELEKKAAPLLLWTWTHSASIFTIPTTNFVPVHFPFFHVILIFLSQQLSCILHLIFCPHPHHFISLIFCDRTTETKLPNETSKSSLPNSKLTYWIPSESLLWYVGSEPGKSVFYGKWLDFLLWKVHFMWLWIDIVL